MSNFTQRAHILQVITPYLHASKLPTGVNPDFITYIDVDDSVCATILATGVSTMFIGSITIKVREEEIVSVTTSGTFPNEVYLHLDSNNSWAVCLELDRLERDRVRHLLEGHKNSTVADRLKICLDSPLNNVINPQHYFTDFTYDKFVILLERLSALDLATEGLTDAVLELRDQHVRTPDDIDRLIHRALEGSPERHTFSSICTNYPAYNAGSTACMIMIEERLANGTTTGALRDTEAHLAVLLPETIGEHIRDWHPSHVRIEQVDGNVVYTNTDTGYMVVASPDGYVSRYNLVNLKIFGAGTHLLSDAGKLFKVKDEYIVKVRPGDLDAWIKLK